MQEEKIGNGQHAKLEHLLDDIRVVVRDSQELLKSGVGALKQKARAGVVGTDRFVREQPYYGLAVAFGGGIVVGLLVAGLLAGGEDESD